APVGSIFREVQLVDAIPVHRRVALTRVEPAPVHLSDAAEQDGGGPEIQRDLRLEVEQQSLVAEMGSGEGIHDRVSSGGWYLGACRAGSLSHAPLRRAQTRAGRTTRGKTGFFRRRSASWRAAHPGPFKHAPTSGLSTAR